MNRMKFEQIYPEVLEVYDISSIYKMKGLRNSFESYRGVFRVSVFRAILDQLIYNDEYENIDSNLTDSNVIYYKRFPLVRLRTGLKWDFI